MDGVKVYSLGVIEYKKALELQLSLLDKRMTDETEDVLLLLQHPPTFTVGRNKKTEHLLINREELMKRGIHFEVISRGGDITYHGPGQLVGYVILDLNKFGRDIHKFLRNLEETIILALKDFDIEAERVKGLTGVWSSGRKVASIGVGIKRWITYHGFALNVNTDLSYFDMIVPCGIDGVRVTSIKQILRSVDDIQMGEVATSVITAFGRVFERKLSCVFDDMEAAEGLFDASYLLEIEKKLRTSSKLLAKS